MKIKEIEIKNFGKFSNQRFVFRDGIQVFYGENEFGKSTIYGFLKAMLFGMERGRGKAAHNDFSAAIFAPYPKLAVAKPKPLRPRVWIPVRVPTNVTSLLSMVVTPV